MNSRVNVFQLEHAGCAVHLRVKDSKSSYLTENRAQILRDPVNRLTDAGFHGNEPSRQHHESFHTPNRPRTKSSDAISLSFFTNKLLYGRTYSIDSEERVEFAIHRSSQPPGAITRISRSGLCTQPHSDGHRTDHISTTTFSTRAQLTPP